MADAFVRQTILAHHPVIWSPCDEGSGAPQDRGGVAGGLTASATGAWLPVQGRRPLVAGERTCYLVGSGQQAGFSNAGSTLVDRWGVEVVVQFRTFGTNILLSYMGNSGSNGWGILAGNTAGRIQALAGGVAVLNNHEVIPVLNEWYYIALTRRFGGLWHMWVGSATFPPRLTSLGGSVPNAPTIGPWYSANCPTGNEVAIRHATFYTRELDDHMVRRNYTALMGLRARM